MLPGVYEATTMLVNGMVLSNQEPDRRIGNGIYNTRSPNVLIIARSIGTMRYHTISSLLEMNVTLVL